jgi:glycolate oxidase
VPTGTPLTDSLVAILGTRGYFDDPASRLVYARDASHLAGGTPLGVALPADPGELRRVVAACAAAGVTVVCRGTGTGLSGGAVPGHGELVLATARMNRLTEVDLVRRRVHVEPGVLNDQVSRHAAPAGLHFAPDPSSQSAASIGGNIAENAGGPHCLRLGVTLRHVLGLEWVDAEGRAWVAGRALAAERGIGLVSLLVGSEGTLGLVTGADLNLVPDAAEVATLLAFFPVLDDAVRSVVTILGAGMLPVAMEMVDQAMLLAVEEAFGFGFPTDIQGAMIVEFAGSAGEVAEDTARAEELLAAAGAREVRRSADERDRAELWKCRKKAFGAVGRLAPSYVTMDVVVPLGELPGLVKEIQVIKRRHGVEIATAFHAGDGNLHPGVQYDDRDPAETRNAHAAADEIIRAALARGGSATGEHGVGIEKLHVLPWQLDEQAARLMHGVKTVFDPAGRLNPGKLLPDLGAAYAPVKPLPQDIEFHWDSLTVTAPATASVAEVQDAALARGFWIPVGALRPGAGCGLGLGGTVGDLVSHLVPGPALCAAGTARDYLLEIWAVTGDGVRFHAGAPVFKNVAGYDLAHMICGSGGMLAAIEAATFQLRPVPAAIGVWQLSPRPGCRPSPGAFRPLFGLLGSRDSSLGGPVCLLEAGNGSLGRQVLVLAPGRDRTWDLGALGPAMAEVLEGFEVSPPRIATVPEIAACPGDYQVPSWSLDAPDWYLVDAGEEMPWSGNRLIWQSAPRVWWTPDAPAVGSGPYVDHFMTGGTIQAAPAPVPGVPREILRGLKNLFDPAGRLCNPAWLQEGGHD